MPASQATASPLSIRLFGPFEVRVNGTPIPRLRSRKGQLLLALLTLRDRAEVERTWLAGLLWPECSTSRALATLRRDLTDVRRALGPEARRLRSPNPRTLCLDLEGAVVDVATFDAAMVRGDTASLERAIAVHRGPLLEGWAEEWVFQERQTREQAFLQTLETLAERARESRDWAAAERYLSRAAAVDPLRERTQRALMTTLAGAGNYAGAIQVYRELRLRLHREVNVDPDPETQRLFQQLRAEAREKAAAGKNGEAQPTLDRVIRVVTPDTPEDRSPSRSPEPLTNNLPLQLTSFIGREDQMAEVQQWLAVHRLVTLTGAGGCGKTRLAFQVAAGLLGDRSGATPGADGVWFVDLAPLEDPQLLPQRVAAALPLQEEPGRPILQTLTEYLRPRRLLLLLDNCEHLVTACARLVEMLLRVCPDLRVLATSRESLQIPGEQPYRVPSLSLPDPRPLPSADVLGQYEAIRLFVERAATVLPSFSLTPANAEAVAHVCRRLDGIPLAIELAATRVKALPVETLAERLDDMFSLLTGGSRTALPRHQTLRALIDWSYHLLPEPQQAMLQRLSVFAGGWTLEAAEQVCSDSGTHEVGDGSRQKAVDSVTEGLSSLPTAYCLLPTAVLDLLTALVEKSLVQYEPREGGARYRLLETIRQHSLDRLRASGEMEAARGRHRDYFATLCELAQPELEGGPEQVAWVHRLEQEHDNLRAAFSSALESDLEVAWRLVAALAWFWSLRCYYGEGYQWLEAVLARDGDIDPALRARVITAGVRLAMYGQGMIRARQLAEEGLVLARECGNRRILARSLYAVAFVIIEQEEYERAGSLLEEGLGLAREGEDRWAVNVILQHLGMVAVARRSYDGATELFTEALALARSAGDKANTAWILFFLSGLAMLREDLSAVVRFAEEGRALGRETGQNMAMGHATEMLARARLAQGDIAAAHTLLFQSHHTLIESDQLACFAHCLEAFAGMALAEGRPGRGAQLLGAAHTIATREKLVLRPIERALYDRTVARTRAALGDEEFAKAWAEGQALSLEQILDDPLGKQVC